MFRPVCSSTLSDSREATNNEQTGSTPDLSRRLFPGRKLAGLERMECVERAVVRSRRALTALPPFHPRVAIKTSLKTTSEKNQNASVNVTLL